MDQCRDESNQMLHLSRNCFEIFRASDIGLKSEIK